MPLTHPRIRHQALAGLVLLALTSCGSPAGGGPNALVGHHVHLLSPELMRNWQSLGVTFARPDSVYISAATLLGAPGSDQRAGPGRLAGAVLIPMAHLYGRADLRQQLRLSLAAEYAAVRRENDHVATEAARYPGRAIALCGVDYLRPYAWEEIQRCQTELRSPGIKLHLGSAGTNLLNGDHLAALRRIAALANREQLILFMHFDPQGDRAEVSDVERFIEVVLQPFPNLTVVIAHLGGSGGFGPWARAILRTFQAWLDTEAEAGRSRAGVFFDISAVWLAEDSQGMPHSSPQDAEALEAEFARIGVSRMLFGSDYPVFDPWLYAEAFRTAAGLGPESWDSLARNRLPGFAPGISR